MNRKAPSEAENPLDPDYLLNAKNDLCGVLSLRENPQFRTSASRLALTQQLHATRGKIRRMASALSRSDQRSAIALITTAISAHVLPTDPDDLAALKDKLVSEWLDHAAEFRKALSDSGTIGNQPGKTRWLLVPEIDVIPAGSKPGRKTDMIESVFDAYSPGETLLLFHSHGIVDARGHGNGATGLDAVRSVLPKSFPGPYRVRVDGVYDDDKKLSTHLKTLGGYLAKVMSSRSLCESSWKIETVAGDRQSTAKHSVRLLDPPIRQSVAALQAHLLMSGAGEDFVSGNIFTRANVSDPATKKPKSSSKPNPESARVSGTSSPQRGIQCREIERRAPSSKSPESQQPVQQQVPAYPQDAAAYFGPDGKPNFEEEDILGDFKEARDRGLISQNLLQEILRRYNSHISKKNAARLEWEASPHYRRPAKTLEDALDDFAASTKPIDLGTTISMLPSAKIMAALRERMDFLSDQLSDLAPYALDEAADEYNEIALELCAVRDLWLDAQPDTEFYQ